MRVVANDFTAPEIMKFIRQWTEMTQVEFADTIDRRVGVVRSYEQGTRHYTFKTLPAIVEKNDLRMVIEKKHIA